MSRSFKYVMMAALTTGVLISGCGGSEKESAVIADPIQIILEKRTETDKYFAGEGSPLSDSARIVFKGLQYFPIDTQFAVTATFTPVADGPIFTMQSTGDIADMYQIAGNLQFAIRDTACMLEVYRNVSYFQAQGKQIYFVPFFDKTNGVFTYDGGRYLDFPTMTPGNMRIDFNLAYQPYCYYSHVYSCPIPPRVNSLPVFIMAGEKKL